jgi:sphinganine-1-phosphate aldolase
MRIPAHGLPKDTVLDSMRRARENDFPWREGKLFAYTFEAGPEIEEVGKIAFTEYLTENGLDPTTFPSLRTFENDLVDMARRHLGGGESVVGNFTSGGTESIVLAVKTARDATLAARPHVTRPKMLVPVSAHAAFHKAAHYLGVELVPTALREDTFEACPKDMARKLDEHGDDVILVVASACSYAQGVVDPVTEIAAAALAHGVLCHVDGCMGGFLLPYFSRLGVEVPAFDFRVPGVTSMSMDLHKYGLCPKGASVVLYRDEALRRFQLFACASWTGYTMLNTTVQSSKSGGPLAAAWSVLQFVGEDGYLDIAKRLLAARDALTVGIAKIPGLYVMGKPHASLVAFGSDELSVFSLADALKKKGFAVQAQLAFGSCKENLHMTINPGNTSHIEAFLVALGEATEDVRRAGGGARGSRELGANLSALIEGDTTGEGIANLMASMGGAGGSVPREMADVNALLNELSPTAREKLLLAFVSRMFTPSSE